jgi:zinc transporter ZupT
LIYLILIDYRFGLVTTMAMLFHEIPHEVGDFAVLFQLRYNICQILGFQLLTAGGAMIGTLVGSIIGKIYLEQCLAFTSGGFLYFAINGLMGELKEVKTFSQLFICLLSLSLGLYFMYVFALFE